MRALGVPFQAIGDRQGKSIASARSERRKRFIDALRLTVLISDGLSILASVILVHSLFSYLFPARPSISESGLALLGKYFKQLTFFSIITIYLLRANGLYDFQSIRQPKRIFPLMLKAAVGVLGLEILLIWLMPKSMNYYGTVVLSNLILVFPIIYLCRWVIARQAENSRVAGLYKLRVVILGSAADAEKHLAQIQNDNDYEIAGWVPLVEPNNRLFKYRDCPKKSCERNPLTIRGEHFRDNFFPRAVDDAAPDAFSRANKIQVGKLEDLSAIFNKFEVDAAVILPSGCLQDETIAKIVNTCENEFVQLKVASRFFPVLTSALQPSLMGNLPILGVSQLPLDRFINRLLKRLVDIVGAVVGLGLSAPLIAIFSVLVRLESPGPVFYTQVRNGLRNRHFNIIKIRSMRLDSEVNGAVWAQKDDPRRLRIGGFMRRWNIDELPQFWNVLKGDMSLVGPRPERPELVGKFQNHIPHYGSRQTYQPGMTGWAQVNGWRGDTSLAERIRHDIWYIENWNLWLDVVIMVKTFLKNKNAY